MQSSDTVKPLLQVTGLEHSFVEGEATVHALQGVSFDAHAGEVTAVVGPSGCGKSTLLYLLGLLDRPDHGEIHLEEESITQGRMKPAPLCVTKRSDLSFSFIS